MMRPMKLGGSQLMFGAGCLEHLSTVKGSKAFIVTGGSSMQRTGILDNVRGLLSATGIASEVFSGVEPDPLFSTVKRGAKAMEQFCPDLVIGLGGGSAMDAAKAMWVLYEHPEIETLAQLAPPNVIPELRRKARLICIPSTSGTASEVSRSIVITDDATHIKFGIGSMEMMPDIAICDPLVTLSMPPRLTAETGMDALTHALESLVSTRANYLSTILSRQAAEDIFVYLPKAYIDGSDIVSREQMMNASMAAGMAFTNVSLGIVHSIAHTVGSLFGVAHGLADAIVLPYVMRFNEADPAAAATYASLAAKICSPDLIASVEQLNATLGIPSKLADMIPDAAAFRAGSDKITELAIADGCTKTNPIIPTAAEMKSLLEDIYSGIKRS